MGEALDLFNLENKVIILTGGAGFLASEFADVLCGAGASVVLADVNEGECKRYARELEKLHAIQSMGVFVDLTDKGSIESMVNAVLSKFTNIDVLINNAAYNPHEETYHVRFEDFSLESWNRILAVNLTGVFLCTQAVGKQMAKQGYGNIINISSIYGMVGADQRIYGTSGINSSVAYAASKAGVANLTRYLSAYFEGRNIRVNTLTLGGVFNDQDADFVRNYSNRTHLGRMANKSDYRGAILFLCSDTSAYMTGSNLIVDGGWTAW
jgi:NAD(P)-dependent dehydrogenase (short-subunit alcohol dehydrogenase family)